MIEYYHCPDCGLTADGERFPIAAEHDGTICGRCGSDNCYGLDNDEAEALLAINPLLKCEGCDWEGHFQETTSEGDMYTCPNGHYELNEVYELEAA